MAISFTQYTRPAGKRLTYDIEFWDGGYRITLNGKELKKVENVINASGVGGIEGAKAFEIHAKSAILHLAGMNEE